MQSRPMSAQERKWQAEDDARTLMRAEEVKQDRKRLGAAAKEAQKIATAAQQAANQKSKAAKALVSKKRGK